MDSCTAVMERQKKLIERENETENWTSSDRQNKGAAPFISFFIIRSEMARG